jgi:hypothetical protein
VVLKQTVKLKLRSIQVNITTQIIKLTQLVNAGLKLEKKIIIGTITNVLHAIRIKFKIQKNVYFILEIIKFHFLLPN